MSAVVTNPQNPTLYANNSQNVMPSEGALHWCPTAAQWDAEYSRGHTIPSSVREEPAHALAKIVPRLSLASKEVLDLGAGNGRNSFFMASHGAQVKALDFSRVALSMISARQFEIKPPTSPVIAIEHDIIQGLPFSSESLDLVLDSYCLCHFPRDSARAAQAEVNRVLRRGGFLVKLHIDTDDTYYEPLVIAKEAGNHISFDPSNGIYKRHFDSSAYLAYMEGFGAYVHMHTTNVKFDDLVRGIRYTRSIFASILKKV